MKDAPKTFKYGRWFRIKLKNRIKQRYLKLNIYKFGIKAVESGWITNEQIKSILRLIRILLKKKIKVKVNSALIVPITKKPLETRMGSGKGERKFWRCPIDKGMIILEFGNISDEDMFYIYKIIANRLPFFVKCIKKIY